LKTKELLDFSATLEKLSHMVSLVTFADGQFGTDSGGYFLLSPPTIAEAKPFCQ
jgi:hypothetical protein